MPQNDPDKLLLGTGEFKFAANIATAAAGMTAGTGYTDFGNVKAFTIQPETEGIEHIGSYRGIRRTDRRKVTKADIGYVLKLDEYGINQLLYMYYGSEGTAFTQTAHSIQAIDTMEWATTAGVIGQHYPIKVSGVRVVDCTAVVLTTLVEDTDYEVDLVNGWVKLLTAQAGDINGTVTSNAITSASDNYMKAVDVLTTPQREGIAQLTVFDDHPTAPIVLDHQDFGCSLSINGQSEVDGQNFSEMELLCQLTVPVGTVYIRDL